MEKIIQNKKKFLMEIYFKNVEKGNVEMMNGINNLLVKYVELSKDDYLKMIPAKDFLDKDGSYEFIKQCCCEKELNYMDSNLLFAVYKYFWIPGQAKDKLEKISDSVIEKHLEIIILSSFKGNFFEKRNCFINENFSIIDVSEKKWNALRRICDFYMYGFKFYKPTSIKRWLKKFFNEELVAEILNFEITEDDI